MGHRKDRRGAAARREGDFADATALPDGPERDLLLGRAAHASRHIGNGALRRAFADQERVPAQPGGDDYERIAARHFAPDATVPRPEDAWSEVAAEYARTRGQVG